jgi:hypothetical protein
LGQSKEEGLTIWSPLSAVSTRNNSIMYVLNPFLCYRPLRDHHSTLLPANHNMSALLILRRGGGGSSRSHGLCGSGQWRIICITHTPLVLTGATARYNLNKQRMIQGAVAERTKGVRTHEKPSEMASSRSRSFRSSITFSPKPVLI